MQSSLNLSAIWKCFFCFLSFICVYGVHTAWVHLPMQVHVEARDWHLNVFLSHFYLVRHDLFPEPAGQWAPGIGLSLPPQYWGYRCHHSQVCRLVLYIWTQVFICMQQIFTQWATSLSPEREFEGTIKFLNQVPFRKEIMWVGLIYSGVPLKGNGQNNK